MSLKLSYESESTREVSCVVSLILPPSPHIYRCVQGCYDWENKRGFLEPTLGTNGEMPRATSKAVAPRLV
jgi:hypothetical protein